MSDIQLYNIGTSSSPVIQSQAGKIFSHQPGGYIKFPLSNRIVNNNCLCKYKYLRYFWIYAKVDKTKQYIQFYKPTFLDSYQAAKKAGKEWETPYATEKRPGWEWQLASGYQYAGCFAHRSNVGKWQKLDIFPYSAQCGQEKDPYIPYENYSYPSPAYTGPQSAHYTDPKTGKYYSTPFRAYTGVPSLMRMLVSSYECCNGEGGCGTRTNGPNNDLIDQRFDYCTAWFSVKWKILDDGTRQYTSVGSPQDAYCGKGYYTDVDDPISCTQARIRRHRLKQANVTCEQCLEALRNDVLNSTPPKLSCRIYRLYQYTTTDCVIDGSRQVSPSTVSYIPSQVWGIGQGLLPEGSHTEQLIISCGMPVHFFRWVKSKDEYTQPDPPTQQIGLNTYGYQCQCTDYGLQSDSISSEGAEPPCNIPDPPPYKYKQISGTQGRPVTDFQHTLFDIWILKMNYYRTTRVRGDDGRYNCSRQFSAQENAQGFANYQKQYSGLTDYEIFQKGLIPLLQKGLDTSQYDGGQGGFAVYWTITGHGCHPGNHPNFTRSSPTKCSFWYQTYASDNCNITHELGGGYCYNWTPEEPMNEETFTCKYGGVTDQWVRPYNANSDVLYKVIHITDQFPYCGVPPQFPSTWLRVAYAPVTFPCDYYTSPQLNAVQKYYDEKLGWPVTWIQITDDQLDEKCNVPAEVFRTGNVTSVAKGNKLVTKDQKTGRIIQCSFFAAIVLDETRMLPQVYMKVLNSSRKCKDSSVQDIPIDRSGLQGGHSNPYKIFQYANGDTSSELICYHCCEDKQLPCAFIQELVRTVSMSGTIQRKITRYIKNGDIYVNIDRFIYGNAIGNLSGGWGASTEYVYDESGCWAGTVVTGYGNPEQDYTQYTKNCARLSFSFVTVCPTNDETHKENDPGVRYIKLIKWYASQQDDHGYPTFSNIPCDIKVAVKYGQTYTLDLSKLSYTESTEYDLGDQTNPFSRIVSEVKCSGSITFKFDRHC